jgi:hypothetical protein
VLGLVHGIHADAQGRERRRELAGEGGDRAMRGLEFADECLHLLGVDPDNVLIVVVRHVASRPNVKRRPQC